MDMPQGQAVNNAILAGSPRHGFLIPSPIPTRRARTQSQSEVAAKSEVYKGTVQRFCRQKGHGFIIPENEKEDPEPLFVHISDIDGEYVPKEGDHVSYKKLLIPPKMEKYHAVHVVITHLNEGVSHEKWDSPCSSPRTT
ncbi:calcium-regulated heat-stable protein 1-like [Ylistrum balloti]|uniref:calcium-regulated heat-stable protein 1-like n=1 Tax=Ylistrum balloti TaxID=509963 RepID=UPI002905A5DB|nr:calcium-regulated heat-stable protein 1-like [Ylistrum balloti]